MSFPAKTESGVAAVLNARSACDDDATTSVAVEELAPKAWLPALTVAVSVIIVPPLTVYTTVSVAVEPAAILGLVQLTGGEIQVQPGAAVVVTDENVVLAGVASINVAAVAAAAPVLTTTCV
jgi:hypothetical protein